MYKCAKRFNKIESCLLSAVYTSILQSQRHNDKLPPGNNNQSLTITITSDYNFIPIMLIPTYLSGLIGNGMGAAWCRKSNHFNWSIFTYMDKAVNFSRIGNNSLTYLQSEPSACAFVCVCVWVCMCVCVSLVR